MEARHFKHGKWLLYEEMNNIVIWCVSLPFKKPAICNTTSCRVGTTIWHKYGIIFTKNYKSYLRLFVTMDMQALYIYLPTTELNTVENSISRAA